MSMKLFRFDYLFPCYEGVLVYARDPEDARVKQMMATTADSNNSSRHDVIIKPCRTAGGVVEVDYRSAIAGTIEETRLLNSELTVLNSKFETAYQVVEIND
ncbi:hypothetical protein A9Q88_11990 [Gammaproteobacteria bacterium 50_400_T64]|nr:hypothetical protein A9Q88_11990 [Gammaproteobacteria bacterium 50_400_T64]